MKKSQVVGAAFVAMTIASPALAADLLKAPAAVPYVSGWNGFYIGGEVGGKWVTDDWTTTCVQGGGLAQCGNALNAIQFPGAPDSTASHSFKTSGLRAGVYAGAMFQVNPSWVAGIEGDYAFYSKSSTVGGLLGCSTLACSNNAGFGPPLDPNALVNDRTSVKNKDDFSLRLRAGFLVTPDILVYGTGGVAFQRVEATMTLDGSTSPASAPLGVHTQTDGAWLPGWTVGGGVEWKLAQNWLLRGEYRYSDFGTWKPDFFRASNANIEIFSNVKVTSQIATAGIAYMFPISK
jgi:outer membrane immunogenic protein